MQPVHPASPRGTRTKSTKKYFILTHVLSDVVRAEGIEPSRPCGLRIFIPLRLSPPRQRRVRGLDYPFTIPT